MAEDDNIISGEPEERKMAEEWNGRSPDQIRDDAVQDWHQRAPLKYNEGQKEHGGNLDQRADLIGEAKKENIDQWFYLCSAERERQDLLDTIHRLKKEIGHWREIAMR
tara:strand:+ start:1727 stop:2050 length:324 start_codon:yes stop_codon:yes gene_type:complete